MFAHNHAFLRSRYIFKKVFVLFWLFVVAVAGKAQEACMLIPAPLPQRVAQATLILEGKVTAQRSFWDADHRNIYTTNTIEVYKIFKGRLTNPQQLEIITEGGTVGDKMHIFSATLALQPGQQGVFFLELSRFPSANQVLPGRIPYSVYSSLQGFIQYRFPHQSAHEPFRTYQSIVSELYPTLLAFPSLKMESIRENADLQNSFTPPASVPSRAARTLAAPTLAGFAPDTITAGTGAILTITGQNFGNDRGEGFVEFENANDGGSTYIQPLESDYIFWSDNIIRVRVPSVTAGSGSGVAGSGQLRVKNNSDTRVATSSQELIIRYAVSNIIKEGKAYQPYHIDANGNGGYTLQFAANVPEAGRIAFQRSMQTWTCYTNINWVAAGTTASATTTAEDNINLVRLAGPEDLPINVLGRTISRYEGCQTGGNYSYLVSEFDFEFNDRANWQFGPNGPASTQFDFETTTLHELGHAHQLAHIIQPRAVMHYSISRTQLTRTLSGRNDVEGGNYVTARSFQHNICAPARMAPLVTTACNLPPSLLTFEATLQPEGTALLNWTSQNESNLAYYIVEKSINGVQWNQLTRQTAGGTGHSYTVTDPRPGTNFTYYRLRLVNQNNNYNYSPIRRIGTEENLQAGLQLFPNPLLDNTLHFEYQTPITGVLLIKIYDYLGREHAVLVRNVTKGNNPFYFELKNLASGFYILQVIQGKETQQVKFVKR